MVGDSAALAHVPLVKVGDLRRKVRGAAPVCLPCARRREGVTEAASRRMVPGSRVGRRGRWGLAVDFHVLAQGAGVRVGLIAASHFAVVRLVTRVHVRVLLPVTAVCEFPVTAIKLALKRLLTCVGPLVDLEILRAREDFPAAGKWAGERLLSRVNSYVIDQLVLRLEGFPLARTFLPKADMAALLRSPDVLYGDVVNQLVHGAESFRAGFLCRLLLVDPLADEFLLDGLPHVPQERPRGSVRS